MFDAQLLQADAGATVAVFGSCFRRVADNAIFTLDVVRAVLPVGATNSGVLAVAALHKNLDDTGDGGGATAVTLVSPAGTTTGRHELTRAVGLKELVRYVYTMQAASAAAASCQFRMLSPSWFDSV